MRAILSWVGPADALIVARIAARWIARFGAEHEKAPDPCGPGAGWVVGGWLHAGRIDHVFGDTPLCASWSLAAWRPILAINSSHAPLMAITA